MRILTLNCGSSSLKFDVFETKQGGAAERVVSGDIERIGGGARANLQGQEPQEVEAPDMHSAFAAAMDTLAKAGYAEGLDAIGHRVVHGGPSLQTAARIDDAVLEAVRDATDLAPLHNAPALEVIEAARERFGDSITMAASFDTAFFAELPEAARTYALPYEISQRHGVRRYGFHGLAHGYMSRRFRELRPEIEVPRVVTLQLGSGCSVAAIAGGKPVDTSMGFTPLEGLVMGTRTGNIDPALPLYIQTHAKMTADEVESMLNKASGLLGISGVSSDMRDLREAAGAGNARARLAIELFERSIVKYIGAYTALLGGAHAILFGGGIGERDDELRAKVCRAFEWAGLQLDGDANANANGREALITRPGSAMDAWVIPVDEARVIAEETAALLQQPGR